MLFENKWMVDLIDMAMGKIYDYPNNGNLYHEILSKSYLTAFRYTERELLESSPVTMVIEAISVTQRYLPPISGKVLAHNW